MTIRRIIYFRVRGNRLNDFVNAVRRSDIRCYSQRCMCEEYTGQIYYSDLEKMNILANEYNMELIVDGYGGKAYKVIRYKKRYGFFAGVLFLFLFISYISNTVVKIEINGSPGIDRSHVLSILAQSGLKKGKYIPSIDLERCENELNLKHKNIGWSSVRRSGCRIVVDIHEIGETPSTIKNNIPCNIISSRDAVIVSVYAEKGRCRVQQGDAVSKGDVIISGILSGDTDTYRIVHAHGKVSGEYCERQKFVQYFTENEKVYYSQKRRNYFDFFGFKVPTFIGDTYTENADYTENTRYIKVVGREIPIGLTSSDYKYYKWDEVQYNIEQASEKIEEQIKMFEKNFYTDCEIAGKNVVKTRYEDRIEYDVEYVIRGEIGMEGELFSDKNNLK